MGGGDGEEKSGEREILAQWEISNRFSLDQQLHPPGNTG